MNPRSLLQEIESGKERDELIDVVYDVFAGYCMDNDITEDDISTPMLEQLAEGFVERGLGVPVSEETELNDKVWDSLGEAEAGHE